MKDIAMQLSVLGLLVISNLLLGIYYNVNVKKIKFNFYKMLNGIVKASIIVFGFVSLYFAFYEMPELTESVGFEPKVIMFGAIVLYVTKVGKGLADILGIEEKKNI